MDNILLKISYHRQERSKDSNGSENTFIITNDKKILFSGRNWGFKAMKNPEDITNNLSSKEFNQILNYIEEKEFNQNFDKFIEINNNQSFNVFTYYMSIYKKGKLYNIIIGTNENNLLGDKITPEKIEKLNSTEKVFYFTQQLFFYLKNIIKEKQ